MDLDKPKTKSTRWNWLLWWKIDKGDLEYQVAEYSELSIWESMRGISVLCMLLSAVLTVAFTIFGAAGFDATAYVDAALFVILAIFIFFGHRWAMIAAMVLWTLEKTLIVVDGVGPNHSGGLVLGQILWWAAYMHALYFAFRIEQMRRKSLSV